MIRNKALVPVFGVLLVTLAAWLISARGAGFAAFYLLLPLVLGYLYVVFRKPEAGLLSYILISYFAIGISRYIEGPFGLGVDIVLLITWISVLFSYRKIDFRAADSPLTYLLLGWFIYTFLLLFNPEASSKVAWVYAVRGLSVYFALAVPLVLILFNKKKDLGIFLRYYFVLTVLAALWGLKQKYFGTDGYEQAWLDEGAYSTHVLMGRLRVFSFLSDAGQFGALMAHAVIISVVLCVSGKEPANRWLYAVLALFFAFSLAISGSRGAVIIVFSGLGIYLLLARNFRLLVPGIFLVACLFSFLKFTSIGSGVYEVQRLRSALDFNDASFQVRLENQRLLADYLAVRPLGGGIGSGGSWGQRFSPGTFLAEIPYDSWYVKIWVETGIVGLLLYLTLILAILFLGFFKLRKVRDSVLRSKLTALYAGYFGLCIGSYGNQIYGQIPLSAIIVFSLAFIFMAPRLDIPEHEAVS
jgi:O-antigen ligase